MLMRRRKSIATAAQSRQRELSWALYVTEGYVANIAHLQAVNAYTMTRADLQIIKQARKQAEDIALMLREAMGGLT